MAGADRPGAEMEQGTPPTDEKVQVLARRWHELVQMFTGGDEGITRSLGVMFRENPDVAAAYGLDEKVHAYVAQALRKE